MIIRRLSVCAAMLFLIAAPICAMLPAQAAAGNTELFPLTQGSWWSYKSTDGKGKNWKSKLTVSSVKPAKDGTAVYKVTAVDGIETSLQFYMKRETSTLLERIEFTDKPAKNIIYKPAKLILDSKIQPNNIWQWFGKVDGKTSESERYKVYPGERIKVPAGEFDCARVESFLVRDHEITYYTRWYCRGVGLVKLVVATKNGKFTQDLTGFKVN